MDKEKYFKDHLPYNLGILMAHYTNTQKPWTDNQDILRAMFVGSLVKGRLFLEVLGITYSESLEKLVTKKKNKKDDVDAIDLGGDLIKADTLDKETADLLYKYLFITNKAEAHLTSEKEYDLDVIKPATLKIAFLVKENIYKERPFPIEIPSI